MTKVNHMSAEGFLHFGKLQQIEMAEVSYRATIPAGVLVEDVVRPSFWKHYAKQLKINDTICALWEDGSQEVDLRVRHVANGEVRAVIRHHIVYDEVDEADLSTDAHEVVWKGPSAKWCVINKDTKAVVKDKINSKVEASEYMKTHMLGGNDGHNQAAAV